jgi:N-acyl-D-amino-acid deacylase
MDPTFNRRSFLRFGTVALSGLCLPEVLRSAGKSMRGMPTFSTDLGWLGALVVIAVSLSGPVSRYSWGQAPKEGAAFKGQPKTDEISTSLSRALPVIQKAAANYPKHRQCFSCHHQTLPMLAMVTARDRHLSVDDKLLQGQAEFTHQSFQGEHEALKAGKGIGGKAMTVAYGLWALRLADWRPDDTTEAMVTYLLKTQHQDGYWTGQVVRPPLEESYFTATTLAAQVMNDYATESQRGPVDAAVAKAQAWLTSAAVKNQEDKVFRLWGLHLLDARPEEIESARRAVLAVQREDGGWAQTDDLKSDAYATGQTLFVLQETGFSPGEQAYQRGVKFLLQTQCADGSWFVQTRSKPIQKDFDNGDPHGKNQFISTPASCWALAALAAASKK